MKFRIAIGRCDCRPPYLSVADERVCEAILERLTSWRDRLPADLAAIPTELFEEEVVEGHRVTFGTYKLEVSPGETLVVYQTLLHTWSRPTYLAIGTIGRMYAEGLLVRNGKVEFAPDELMWQFR